MNRCVCCGAPVPEGTQVCWSCLNYMFPVSRHKDPACSTCPFGPCVECIFEEKEI